ncbi:VOC family protein [Aestuariimicrobium ganziense]|uniref:VOC family protein n=1 Tax=Aestuariimicrobium ganziense TaxID=2773677 RepID=UPI001940AAE5|nr:VOC family protein [Aestuariimicrobium ganziense]
MLLHQVALKADDLERATEFWTELLGEGPIASFDPPGLVFFGLGEVRLLLERNAPASLVYLRVDDVDATVEQLRERGVQIDTEPHTIFSDAEGLFGSPGEDERMAFLRDSEGNLVGLASRRPITPQ